MKFRSRSTGFQSVQTDEKKCGSCIHFLACPGDPYGGRCKSKAAEEFFALPLPFVKRTSVCSKWEGLNKHV